jgi:hypothetical protein
VDPKLLLRSRRWLYRRRPFAHVLADDVFVPHFYESLCTCVATHVASGAMGNFPGLDVLALDIDETSEWPLAFFVSPGWVELMCSVVGIGVTGRVTASVRHQPRGSRDGPIHNDLVTENVAGIATRRPSVSALLYVGDGLTKPGDGGGTGLFWPAWGEPAHPDAVVAPLGNRMLLFESNEATFHGFLRNPRFARSGILSWTY